MLRDPHDNFVYFGTTCAARAMKVPVKTVREGITAANRRKMEAERAARAEQARIEGDRWRTYLIQRTGGIKDYRGDWDIFAMIQRLGGFAEARKGYRR